MKEKVFALKLDTKRLGDPAYDAVVLPFNGSNKLVFYFTDPVIYGVELLPEEILYLANFSYIKKYDLLFNDTGLLIVSLKMLELIRSNTSVQVTVIPVVLIDDTYLEEKFGVDGKLLDEVPVSQDFYAIRFEELKSYFDFENSDFRPSRFNPEIPSRIKKLVLKEPKGGFPEIFRTREKASQIFVRESFKNIIEEAGIKGCLFEEVDVSSKKTDYPA